MSNETPSIHPPTVSTLTEEGQQQQQFAQLSSEQTPNAHDVMPTASSSAEPTALQVPGVERIGRAALSSPCLEHLHKVPVQEISDAQQNQPLCSGLTSQTPTAVEVNTSCLARQTVDDSTRVLSKGGEESLDSAAHLKRCHSLGAMLHHASHSDLVSPLSLSNLKRKQSADGMHEPGDQACAGGTSLLHSRFHRFSSVAEDSTQSESAENLPQRSQAEGSESSDNSASMSSWQQYALLELEQNPHVIAIASALQGLARSQGGTEASAVEQAASFQLLRETTNIPHLATALYLIQQINQTRENNDFLLHEKAPAVPPQNPGALSSYQQDPDLAKMQRVHSSDQQVRKQTASEILTPPVMIDPQENPTPSSVLPEQSAVAPPSSQFGKLTTSSRRNGLPSIQLPGVRKEVADIPSREQPTSSSLQFPQILPPSLAQSQLAPQLQLLLQATLPQHVPDHHASMRPPAMTQTLAQLPSDVKLPLQPTSPAKLPTQLQGQSKMQLQTQLPSQVLLDGRAPLPKHPQPKHTLQSQQTPPLPESAKMPSQTQISQDLGLGPIQIEFPVHSTQAATLPPHQGQLPSLDMTSLESTLRLLAQMTPMPPANVLSQVQLPPAPQKHSQTQFPAPTQLTGQTHLAPQTQLTTQTQFPAQTQSVGQTQFSMPTQLGASQVQLPTQTPTDMQLSDHQQNLAAQNQSPLKTQLDVQLRIQSQQQAPLLSHVPPHTQASTQMIPTQLPAPQAHQLPVFSQFSTPLPTQLQMPPMLQVSVYNQLPVEMQAHLLNQQLSQIHQKSAGQPFTGSQQTVTVDQRQQELQSSRSLQYDGIGQQQQVPWTYAQQLDTGYPKTGTAPSSDSLSKQHLSSPMLFNQHSSVQMNQMERPDMEKHLHDMYMFFLQHPHLAQMSCAVPPPPPSTIPVSSASSNGGPQARMPDSASENQDSALPPHGTSTIPPVSGPHPPPPSTVTPMTRPPTHL